jgi:hypothetical protein
MPTLGSALVQGKSIFAIGVIGCIPRPGGKLPVATIASADYILPKARKIQKIC